MPRLLRIDCEGRYLVIGTRPDGDRLVLAAADTYGQAERLARQLRAGCDNYLKVEVEDAGER